jgi:2'-5' RNA ligase
VDAEERSGLRLFLAVDIPREQIQSVTEAVAALQRSLPGARWTAPETWHVTLKFFGEVPEPDLEGLKASISDAVTGTGAVESQLTDFGAFPAVRRARVLWVGIEDSMGTLGDLAARLEEIWPDRYPRPLHPHLTLARLKEPSSVTELLQGAASFPLNREHFLIGRATLFRSHLGRGGARYEALHHFAL